MTTATASPDHTNGGASTVLAAAMGEMKNQMAAVLSKLETQSELLTRFDERQKSWATKQEVSEVAATSREALAPVAAKSDAAHNRIDNLSGDLISLNVKVDGLEAHLQSISNTLAVRAAEVRGGWWVGGRVGAWVVGIAAAVVAAYLTGKAGF